VPRVPREAFLDFLAKHPEATTRDVARAVGLTSIGALLRLRSLQRQDLVTSEVRSNALHHQLTEAGQQWLRAGPATSLPRFEGYVLRPYDEARILAYIRAHPGASLRVLMTALGLSHGPLRGHLLQLLQQGRIVEHRMGASRRFFPAP
jgi:predicted ArsR family transcriptional regulator